jgi:hypothetical protein
MKIGNLCVDATAADLAVLEDAEAVYNQLHSMLLEAYDTLTVLRVLSYPCYAELLLVLVLLLLVLLLLVLLLLLLLAAAGGVVALRGLMQADTAYASELTNSTALRAAATKAATEQ